VKLAKAMGLEIPESVEDEQNMWWALSSFVYENDPNAIVELNKFRKSAPVAYADEGPEERAEAASRHQRHKQDEHGEPDEPDQENGRSEKSIPAD
jgi:hypothetical protein